MHLSVVMVTELSVVMVTGVVMVTWVVMVTECCYDNLIALQSPEVRDSI